MFGTFGNGYMNGMGNMNPFGQIANQQQLQNAQQPGMVANGLSQQSMFMNPQQIQQQQQQIKAMNTDDLASSLIQRGFHRYEAYFLAHASKNNDTKAIAEKMEMPEEIIHYIASVVQYKSQR